MSLTMPQQRVLDAVIAMGPRWQGTSPELIAAGHIGGINPMHLNVTLHQLSLAGKVVAIKGTKTTVSTWRLA